MNPQQPLVRLVLAAEHEGATLYQYGWASVSAQTEAEDRDVDFWPRSYDRPRPSNRRSVIDWAPGWPVETMRYPAEADFLRQQITPAPTLTPEARS